MLETSSYLTKQTLFTSKFSGSYWSPSFISTITWTIHFTEITIIYCYLLVIRFYEFLLSNMSSSYSYISYISYMFIYMHNNLRNICTTSLLSHFTGILLHIDVQKYQYHIFVLELRFTYSYSHIVWRNLILSIFEYFEECVAIPFLAVEHH